MSQLQVKTRGNSSPQGKQRVYFCCHGADFDRYFEPVCAEILAKQNCAIYYYAPGTAAEPAERELELGQMQLFVMPVTRRLLTDTGAENTAITDFDLAIAHHIPVLPLMQEAGLVELFNRRCGDLQFLDKDAVDATAISYDDKLEKFLNDVLVGDELAAQVRAAFDAYVFLSYRKKDRKFAQELMQLIHQNDFCRDIAIWYDEFLTPGENFNDAIRAALEKSQLFALVVTPNLVNEPNYVASVEYPMARAAGMHILPARMTETDEAALKAMYQGIDTPTDARDPDALSQALLTRLENVAKAESNTDPLHRFFIGLAYLSDIDVEVDHQRAVSLITGAAEAGLPQAVSKLVSMYNTGEGVPRSYAAAIQWQRRLVELYRKAYDASRADADRSKLAAELWVLGGFLENMGDLEGAKAVYLEMRGVEDAAKGALFDTSTSRNGYLALTALCRIARRQNDLPLAREYNEACLRSIVLRMKEGSSSRDFAVTNAEAGRIAKAMGDLDRAQRMFEQAYRSNKQRVDAGGSLRDRRDLLIDCEDLGNLALKREDPHTAPSYYQLGLQLAEGIDAENSTPTSQRSISICCGGLGDAAKALREFDTARRWYERQLQLAKQLAEQTDTHQSRVELACCYERLGDLQTQLRQTADALTWYKEELAVAEQLPGTPANRRQLATCCAQIARLSYYHRDYATAAVFFDRQLAQFQALAEETGTVEDRRSLAKAYMDQDCHHLPSNDLAGAIRCYQTAQPLLLAIAQETGSNSDRRALAQCYSDTAAKYQQLAKPETAAAQYKLAVALRRDILAATGLHTDRVSLHNDYDNLAIALFNTGDLQGAKTCCQTALALLPQIEKELGAEKVAPTRARVEKNLALVNSRLAAAAQTPPQTAQPPKPAQTPPKPGTTQKGLAALLRGLLKDK